MRIKKAKQIWIKSILSVGLMVSAVDTLGSSPTRYYKSPMGEANWEASGNPLRCGLRLDVPDFGVAYFEHYATKDPHFILHKYQQSPGYRSAKVTANPPVWKPGRRNYFISKTQVKPGKYGFYLSRVPALKMLNYLAEGYKTMFSYQSEEGFPVIVALSPVNFQTQYEKYIECVGHLLPFDYSEVKDLTFYFPFGGWDLTDKEQALLDKVVKYTFVDRRVKTIKIAGYTDDSGRQSVNNAVSERRAKAVEAYLLGKNINPKLLSVTWYGEKRPVADNDNANGQQENRRVTIKVILR